MTDAEKFKLFLMSSIQKVGNLVVWPVVAQVIIVVQIVIAYHLIVDGRPVFYVLLQTEDKIDLLRP